MVEFITGISGTGKTSLMFERIKASAAVSDKNCIIVPEQYSYEFDKTLYHYLGAAEFNELFSLSFTSLSRQLFQFYGDSDRKGEYADDMAKMILIYQAVSEVQKLPGQLNYFHRQSSKPGFAEEVLKLICDLKRAGITPQQLESRSAFLDHQLMDKTNDIASIYYTYERLMEEYGFKDNLENIREAAKIAAFHQYFKGYNIFIDEFESFTGDQLEFLKVILSAGANICMTLRTDDVYAEKYSLFETVNNTFRRLTELCRELGIEWKVTECHESYRFNSPDLEYLSTHIIKHRNYEADKAPEPSSLRIFEARDMYGEIEYVCATIKRMIHADKTLRYNDIAVISNTIEQYSDILVSSFETYGIPCFMSLERSVSHTPLMVYFTTLLELAGMRKLSTELILRLLKSGISGVSPTDTALLENYCYRWGIDGDMWLSPFTGEDDSLEQIESLRVSVIGPIRILRSKIQKSETAAEICVLLYKYLTDSGIDSNLSELMGKLIEDDRDNEATELKRLWGCLMEILDSTASTLRENITSFRELSAIMRSMIGRLKYSLPPQTLDAVTVASARTARLNSPRIVFVMGAVEGSFPNQVSLHGLFSEADKQQLLDKRIEISRPVSDLIASERLIVYKSLTSASDMLVLTYPLSDLSGQTKYPAQSIMQIKEMFGKRLRTITEGSISPDYYAVTLRSAFYHYMQDRKSATKEIASIRRVLSSEPEYDRRISAVLSRSGHSNNYRVDTKLMQKLKSFKPLRLSSTALENYSRCHFMYFCNDFLKLKAPEKVDLDFRVAGDIGHECFRSILSSRSKEDFIGLSYEQLSEEIHSAAEKYCKEKLSGDFGKDDRFSLIRSKIEEQMSAVLLHTQQELMSTSFVPTEYEMKIKGEQAVRLSYAENKELLFEGIADRADVCFSGKDKYVRIIDYKSSGKTIDKNTLASGMNMQMLLYLFAVTGENGRYSDCVPSGVLYSPIFGSEPKPDDSREEAVSRSASQTELRATGLVLGDPMVLEAMENGVAGKFVPAKYKTDRTLTQASSCISQSSMDKLREFTFRTLKDMAASLLEGHVEALPLSSAPPCKYCNVGNVCGNSDASLSREPDANKLSEAEQILSEKTERKEV